MALWKASFGESTRRTPLLPSLLNLPLPRPPARTWAFITEGPLITDVTCLACSGVVTRNPGGTGSLNSWSNLWEWCSSRLSCRTWDLRGA